jgi:glutamate-ammonia-ligase adenylyltransferase
MECLRHFKHVQVLRVAAADIAGALPVRQVSDHLSAIADVTVKAALRLAREDLEARYGQPLCRDTGAVRTAGFVIIGYGKLGGLELGYGSDLDLVFLHDSRGTDQETDGPSRVSNQEYFGRLGQRVIHFLATATPGGRAYEVDTRLRPSGASGLLVNSLEAFEEYQEHHAWTWEHQALVRARAVAGDACGMEGYARIRRHVAHATSEACAMTCARCALRCATSCPETAPDASISSKAGVV